MTKNIPESAHEMIRAGAVLADKERHELMIAFDPKEGDEALLVTLPAGSVGHFITQVAAAHGELTMKGDEEAGVFLPLTLSGARAASGPSGEPILLLQFDGVFELAVTLPKSQVEPLSRAAAEVHAPARTAPPKRH